MKKQNFITGLTKFVLLAGIMFSSVLLHAQTITLNYQNTQLETVLKSITDQTDYKFVYAGSIIDTKQIVSVNVSSGNIATVLDAVFSGTDISYQIADKQIVLSLRRNNEPASVQTHTLRGTVLDEIGEPLPGAMIVVKGNTRKAVIADVDGKFELRDIEPNVVLVISFMGYETQEIRANVEREMRVQLRSTATALEDVVVTGYQTISRERVTGAVATISTKELEKRHTVNVFDNLEGKVAGLVSYDGALMIRGVSTLSAGSNPLLVIDGLPVESISINDLNPYDIESINILKDAASAAIYGARASNGVIVVVSKKAAKHSKVDIEVSANVTVYQKRNVDYADNFYLTPTQQVDLENDFYRWYYNDSPGASGNQSSISYLIAGTSYGYAITPVQHAHYQLATGAINQAEFNRRLAQYKTQNFAQDFADAALLNRTLQQYNLSVRNRTENFQSNLVVNFKHDNTGIINGLDNTFNVFYKGSYDMTKWMTINFSVNSILNRTNSSNSQYATNPFNVPAYQSLYNEDGSYASHIPYTVWFNDYATLADNDPALRPLHFNHVQELNYDRTKTERHNQRYHGELLFKIIDGLTLNTQFVYETNRYAAETYSEAESFIMRFMRNVYTRPNATGTGYQYMIPETGGKLVSRNTRGDSWTARAQVNFARTFANDHAVNVLAGMEFRDTRSSGKQNLLLGWDDQLQSHSSTLVSYPDLAAYTSSAYFLAGFPALTQLYQPYIQNVIVPVSEVWHRNASGYANLTYTYKGRYNAFGSVRKDYADVFGLASEFRGAPFWSIGASWNIEQEEFMSKFKFIDALKLRTSYGYTGNIYQGATSYMTASTSVKNRYNSLPMALINSPGNSELSWEQTGTFNIGLDFSLLNYRLSGTLDWYNKKSDKVFSNKSLETTKGFTSLVMNLAEVKNNGLELTLAYDWFRPQNRKDFAWRTSGTAAWNKNEITYVETQAATASAAITSYKPGYPVSALYSYVFAGLNADGVQTWLAADGNIIVGNTIANNTPNSVVFSGQSVPKHTFAMENYFSWNGISLNITMVYYGGHVMRALQVQPIVGAFPSSTMASYYVDAWMPNKTNTIVPGIGEHNKTTTAAGSVQNNTDIFVHPADFLKIRNIVLGYDLPKDFIARIGFENITLRFQINDPAPLWTKNKVGVDPETRGIRRLTYYTFGLNFKF